MAGIGDVVDGAAAFPNPHGPLWELDDHVPDITRVVSHLEAVDQVSQVHEAHRQIDVCQLRGLQKGLILFLAQPFQNRPVLAY